MKRFKLNWAIPGLFAMILIIAAVAWIQTQAAMPPDPAKLATQCSACHTMDSHVSQWQESSHKSVACTACHADHGALGWVKMQLGLVRMQLKDDEVYLSKLATEVPNERCIDCHAREMPWVMQDLEPAELDAKGEPIRPAKNELKFLSATAGHDVHLTKENPLSCTECHTAVSHGPAPEQTVERVQVMHQVCLDCHAQEKVQVEVRNTISCSACHLDMEKVAPADHQKSNFRTVHGDSAKTDATTCTQCHLNPGISSQAAAAPHGVVPVLPAGTIKVSAGLQDSCTACHATTMPHPNDWLKSHAKGYNDKPELCASCHGSREEGFDMTVTGNPRTLSTTDPSCTTCHAQPMPHPDDYVSNGHQAAAKAATQSCEQCHSSSNPVNPTGQYASAQFCKDCHLGSYSHPDGYVFAHPDVLANYGNNLIAAGCIQCHSTSPQGQNSCASCHGSSVTDTQWHPADFVATHKDKLASYGNNPTDAGCALCHAGTTAQNPGTVAQNTCTACHSNGLTNGQPTKWHPKNWWILHAQTTKPTDKESCNKCHSYVEPSCAQCHTRF